MTMSGLIKLESTRYQFLEELTPMLQGVGLQPGMEDINTDTEHVTLRFVPNAIDLLQQLPLVTIITQRTQIRDAIAKAYALNSTYAFVIRNRRDEFVGFLLTDVFLMHPVYFFEQIYIASGASTDIRNELSDALKEWSDLYQTMYSFVKEINDGQNPT